MSNPFVHVELMSTDVGKAKSFYGELFDWKLEDMPTDVGKAKSFYGELFDWKLEDMPFDGGTYTMVNVGDGTGGGIMKNPMPNAQSMWLAYVDVKDLKAATGKAKSLGASILKDTVEVKGMGSFSIITDPTGAMLGLWQSKTG